MSLPFKYPLGTQVWWVLSRLEDPWLVLRQRYTASEWTVRIEYFLEATGEPNLMGWAQERDLWSREEVPGS